MKKLLAPTLLMLFTQTSCMLRMQLLNTIQAKLSHNYSNTKREESTQIALLKNQNELDTQTDPVSQKTAQNQTENPAS